MKIKPRENRICPLSKQGVEDLSHFLLTNKEKTKSRIFLDYMVKTISFKPFKYRSLSTKLNIILNLKFDQQGLPKKLVKLSFTHTKKDSNKKSPGSKTGQKIIHCKHSSPYFRPILKLKAKHITHTCTLSVAVLETGDLEWLILCLFKTLSSALSCIQVQTLLYSLNVFLQTSTQALLSSCS